MYVVCGGDEMRPAKITLFPPSTFSGPPLKIVYVLNT